MTSGTRACKDQAKWPIFEFTLDRPQANADQPSQFALDGDRRRGISRHSCQAVALVFTRQSLPSASTGVWRQVAAGNSRVTVFRQSRPGEHGSAFVVLPAGSLPVTNRCRGDRCAEPQAAAGSKDGSLLSGSERCDCCVRMSIATPSLRVATAALIRPLCGGVLSTSPGRRRSGWIDECRMRHNRLILDMSCVGFVRFRQRRVFS